MAPPREAASIDEQQEPPRAELPREDIWGTALMVPLRDDQMEPEQATPDDTKRRGIKRTPAATLMLDAFNNEQWYGCTIITIKPKWPSIRLSNGKPRVVWRGRSCDCCEIQPNDSGFATYCQQASGLRALSDIGCGHCSGSMTSPISMTSRIDSGQ